MISLRAELPEDHAAVHHVNELAFGRAHEADLVAVLRRVAKPQISLVASNNEQVVGHIFFSPVVIENDEQSFTAMGLAPLAVLPEYQKQGVGSELVRAGLRECARLGHNVVVVLGHPHYYPRFGFAPAHTKGLRCEFPMPDEVFMVLELSPDALQGRRGLVKYLPEFNEF